MQLLRPPNGDLLKKNRKLSIINNQNNSFKANIRVKVSKDYGNIPKPIKKNSSKSLFF